MRRTTLSLLWIFSACMAFTGNAPDGRKNPNPAFFLENKAYQQSGKKLVHEKGVVAILQTLEGRIRFTATGAHINLPGQTWNQGKRSMEREEIGERATGTRSRLRMGFAPARSPKPRLASPLKAPIHFMYGPKDNWRRHQKAYASIVYDNVWDGISLHYETREGRLVMRLEIAPGANLDDVLLETGADRLRLKDKGGMSAILGEARMTYDPPIAYQQVDGKRVSVPVNFSPLKHGRFALKSGDYQQNKGLTLELVHAWGSYIGSETGAFRSDVKSVALGSNDEIYLAGNISDFDHRFLPTQGAYDETWNGRLDGFVVKLSADGTTVEYATLLGGSSNDGIHDIAVDNDGNAYVVGYTWSEDFPITPNAYSSSMGDWIDGFITKFNATGSDLLFSTYLGGRNPDYVHRVLINSVGQVCVTGRTSSPDFPITINPGGGHFLALFEPDGSDLIASTSLLGIDVGGFAIDREGNYYMSGRTGSEDFPVTPGAAQATIPGTSSAFVASFTPDLQTIRMATYIGGTNFDESFDVAVDDDLNAYVVGKTHSSNFPITPTAFDQTFEESEGYVVKVSADGTEFLYATFLGGDQDDHVQSVVIDASGSAVVMGHTDSTDFTYTPGTYQPGAVGSGDAFIAQINSSGSALNFSSALGGSEGEEIALDLALDASGNLLAIGLTGSVDFPKTAGTYQETFRYPVGPFFTKLSGDASTLLFSGSLASNSGAESANDVFIDDQNRVYVAGSTAGYDFPTTPNVYDTTGHEGYDAFLSCFTADGSDLLFSTYFGGNGTDSALGLHVDTNGQATLWGSTTSSDFPTTTGAFDASYNGGTDVFVAQFDAMGENLVYSTYLGGSEDDVANGGDLNAAGEIHLTGYTTSANFPTTLSAIDTTYDNREDAFVLKFNGDASALAYSTFLGGSLDDIGSALVLDSNGQATIIGTTRSSSFPTTPGSYNPTYTSATEVFVSRINETGDALVYSTFLSGSGLESGLGLALGSDDSAYLTGYCVNGWPTTADAYDDTWNGGRDIFVTQLNPTGTDITYSTYIGGNKDDVASDIVVTSTGNIWLTGYTRGPFPVTPDAIDTTHNHEEDAFALRLSSDRSQVDYATYLGNSGFDNGNALAVSDTDRVTLVGLVRFPIAGTTPGAWDRIHQGFSNGFVITFDMCPQINITAQPLTQSVCLGGNALLSVGMEDLGSATFQWFKDDELLSGQTNSELLVAGMSPAEEGVYRCEITLGCNTLMTDEASLLLSPLHVTAVPTVQALGLNTPFFDVADACALSLDATWQATPTTALTPNGSGVFVDAPTETTLLEASYTDSIDRSGNTQALLLVPNHPSWTDINGDGCNNMEDLWTMTTHWRDQLSDDANGDGLIDIRDLLFINLADPTPCL